VKRILTGTDNRGTILIQRIPIETDIEEPYRSCIEDPVGVGASFSKSINSFVSIGPFWK
jgi:hypothetical protein